MKATRSILTTALLIALGIAVGPNTTWATGNGRVDVCHFPPGSSGNAHTISVSVNAVDGHISNHGDFVGECGLFCEIVCEDNELCTQDICNGAFQCSHVLVNCDDGNLCTNDSCSLGVGCQNDPVDDGTVCDDGDQNTVNDECTDGVCAGHPPAVILIAIFTADPPSSEPRISMEPGLAVEDVFTVEIHANGLVDLYGVAFTLLYDPNEATYLDCDAQGSILTTSGSPSIPCDDVLVGGAKFAAALENGTPGILNVRASKDGLVAGATNGTGLLLTLTFQANGEIPPPGEPFIFEAGSSREVVTCAPGNPLPPCSIPTVPWDGGTLVAII